MGKSTLFRAIAGGLGMVERRPELVKALVIGNTWAWPRDAEPRTRRFSALMGGPIGRFFGLNFNSRPTLP